jgi:D-glycero-alpha-D-manno-heptose-7-phosphate kinase
MIISRAPLRVSFFGGGTDFPEHFIKEGGSVLATAIDKYSYVTASRFHSRLFDYSVRVSYSRGELAKTIGEIQHPVFRECLRYCNLERDIELHTVADLPAFTGLGSSSSFTVALLQALHAYKGEYVAPLQLAYEAIHIERNILGECVGMQDQTTAAVGGFNIIEFHRADDIRVHPLALRAERLHEIEQHLLLVFTGVKRRADAVESAKIKKMAQNTASLRAMRNMVEKGAKLLLEEQSLTGFGELLHQAWMLKRELDGKVSTEEIDELYHRGMAAGAWGGKLLGAGGGGFILFIIPPEKRAQLAAVFADREVIPCRIAAPGVGVVFAA